MIVAQGRRLRRAASLRGTIAMPSDKSIAHRAVICAALAAGRSQIALRDSGADVMSTIGALQSVGVDIQVTGDGDQVIVTVSGQGNESGIARLGSGNADCGNSGTSMRLLAGALASGSGVATLSGDESLVRRPMQRVAQPLRAMGAEIELRDGGAPMVVRGRRPLRGMEHSLPIASAQVVAAISLAALAADGPTTVTVPGAVRDHTERMLSSLGAVVKRDIHSAGGTTTTIGAPHGLRPFELSVPGDFSSAAAWIVAATAHDAAEVRIPGLGLNPTRTALLDVLRSMGADVRFEVTAEEAGEPVGEIVVRGGRRLRSISLGANDVAPLIDELPLLAVAMAAAHGTSEVRGAAELRIKESDRVATMVAALNAAGARVEELDDGWRISAGRPQHAAVATGGDHRVAMALAVAAWTGVAASVELDDQECVAVSYPSFWRDAQLIGAMA